MRNEHLSSDDVSTWEELYFWIISTLRDRAKHDIDVVHTMRTCWTRLWHSTTVWCVIGLINTSSVVFIFIFLAGFNMDDSTHHSAPISIPSKREVPGDDVIAPDDHTSDPTSSVIDQLVSSSPGAVQIKCRRVEQISPLGSSPGLPGLPGLPYSADSMDDAPPSPALFRVCSTSREHKITSEVYTLVYVSHMTWCHTWCQTCQSWCC